MFFIFEFLLFLVFFVFIKIIGILGLQLCDVEIIEVFFKVGMFVVCFDFFWGDDVYYQEILENFKIVVKNMCWLCVVMLDIVGFEFYVINSNEYFIEFQEGVMLVLMVDKKMQVFVEVLFINYDGLVFVVNKGDIIFLGQYLFMGSEIMFVWLEVLEIKVKDVVCIIKNIVILIGSLFIVYVLQVCIEFFILSEVDLKIMVIWGVWN